ncbi:hypothetical protein JOB18_017326 [Solea senegalensis]|uniref:Uncharacterized protein n=1 Tax=Solea senegalensis TaxID=28829 RepID=A0AAV6T5J6_SOLSE|nr:hypothetical protein JOB18_017326 [Solea senegalensis]
MARLKRAWRRAVCDVGVFIRSHQLSTAAFCAALPHTIIIAFHNHRYDSVERAPKKAPFSDSVCSKCRFLIYEMQQIDGKCRCHKLAEETGLSSLLGWSSTNPVPGWAHVILQAQRARQCRYAASILVHKVERRCPFYRQKKKDIKIMHMPVTLCYVTSAANTTSTN